MERLICAMAKEWNVPTASRLVFSLPQESMMRDSKSFAASRVKVTAHSRPSSLFAMRCAAREDNTRVLPEPGHARMVQCPGVVTARS